MRTRARDTGVRWMLVAVAILFVATAAVSVTAVSLQGSSNADAAADEIVQRIGARTADLVAGQLQPAAVSLSQLALMLDSPGTATDAAKEYQLASQLVTMPTLSGAFIAFPDGSFHFVRRDGDGLVLKRIAVGDGVRTVVEGPLDPDLRPVQLDVLADDFDPRTRVWYREAMRAPASTTWTDPYVFFASQEPGVTAAMAVTDAAGEVRAVVGLDLSLTALSESVQNVPIDAHAEAFIVADGSVIAAPPNLAIVSSDPDGDLTLASAQALGLVGAGTDRTATARLGSDGLPDWSIVVRADKFGFVDTVNRQTRLVIAAVVLSVLIGFGLLLAIGVRLRRPIEELVTLADRDPLTDLANRRAILQFGETALRRATRQRSEVTVAVLDVDHFKTVNDGHGHAAGDEALRRIGSGLRRFVRPTDLVGRYGGDEFVVILTDTDIDGARAAIRRITESAEAELQTMPETTHCSITVGMAVRGDRATDIETLIAEADSVLLDAKRMREGSITQDRESAAESHPS